MSINNTFFAKVSAWQGFSGESRLKFHSIPRPPRAASLLTALWNAHRMGLLTSTLLV